MLHKQTNKDVTQTNKQIGDMLTINQTWEFPLVRNKLYPETYVYMWAPKTCAYNIHQTLSSFPILFHRRRNRGAPGACAPPSKFHKLLYKLLTTLYVVSDCAPLPIKKSFLHPCLFYKMSISKRTVQITTLYLPFLRWITPADAVHQCLLLQSSVCTLTSCQDSVYKGLTMTVDGK